MIDNDEQHVRQATVHSREDLVLIVSSAVIKLISIARWLSIVTMLLAIIAAVLVAQCGYTRAFLGAPTLGLDPNITVRYDTCTKF